MDIRTISSAGPPRPVFPVAAPQASGGSEAGERRYSPALYSSPRFDFDPQTRMAILSWRDVNTGKVRFQFPAAEVVERYRRTQASSEAATGETAHQPAAPEAHPKVAASTATTETTTTREAAPGGITTPSAGDGTVSITV